MEGDKAAVAGLGGGRVIRYEDLDFGFCFL